jgi:peptidoglycan/xylan/chitin deacetylase (PgdA/CDA1 family)
MTLGNILRETASRLPAPLLRPFGRPTALFFHGVERHIRDARIQANHHDFARFSAIAAQLKAEFDVLPLSLIGDALAAPKRHRRTVFLMADDGYANNLSEASCVLRSLDLPWTLFVSTRHIDTAERNPVFVARLFYLFAPKGKHEIPNLGVFDPSDANERAADRGIDALRHLDAANADKAVAAMETALGDKLPSLLERFRSDSFLTWPEVAALKAQGVEIGAHAHLHWPMHDGQSVDYLREQAVRSRARIQAEIGPCRYFAYPFGNTGDVGRAAWQAVRDAGYEYAFTTLSGSLDASTNPYLMPRYGLALSEPRLSSLVPVLRTGNGRLRWWQRRLS